MLNVLHLEDMDVAAIAVDLEKKRDEMPQFFNQSPVVVDCSILGEASVEFDFATLKDVLLTLGFIPVGVRNHPVSLNSTLLKSGWAVMRESLKPASRETKEGNVSNDAAQQEIASDNDIQNSEQVDGNQNSAATEPTPVTFKSLTVDRPVRSGQQIYAADSDMTVLAQTSAGSEIMADGSIHVYGPLRGRVLAGAMGNESARIFCQSLQAELIAIAGRYQLLDESDTDLIGKPAMIKLAGEKLIIEPLSA